MLKRIINKIKWLLFEQPSFARIVISKVIPEALQKLPDGITIEIGAGLKQTLRSHLNNDKNYFSFNLTLGHKPDIVGDALFMPFATNSVDNIILVEVLEHISKPDMIIEECFRVLKPGGILVGSTRFILYEHAAPYDYHRFTADSLTYKLHDFNQIQVNKLGNKFQAIMDLISEKWLIFRFANRFLAKLFYKTNDTCYSGVFFWAEK